MQQKIFVDTNIFIYTLFDVDLSKQQAAIALFRKAAQDYVSLWTTEWVMAEIVWFLQRQKFTWNAISDCVSKALNSKGLEVRNKKWLEEVLLDCAQQTDFIDVINIHLISAERILKAYSYDKGLSHFKNITRLEP